MLSVTRARMYGPGFTMSMGGGFKLFDRYARDLPGAERLSIFTNRIAVSSFVDGNKIPLNLKRTDEQFWRVFDFTFVEGRPYGARDVEAAEHVAVISESARDRLLGEGPAVGQSIEVDGQRFRVAGVVANVSEMRNLPFSEVWVPHSTAKTQAYRDELMGGFQAVVLGESRDALPGIRAEFNARLGRVELPPRIETMLAPFETQFEGLARQLLNDRSPESHAPRLIMLLGAVGLLLALLPTVNLVNLNVSRIMERASEIGVRKAFGASSRTLVVQFVVENVLLTCVGAIAAFAVSMLVLDAINSSGMIAHAQLALNHRVFLVGFVLAVVFGTLSGVYPAWRMSRLHPIQALKGEAR
jgi:putative ABC transport system permease protein